MQSYKFSIHVKLVNFGRFLNKSAYKVNFLCANISEISTKSESRELWLLYYLVSTDGCSPRGGVAALHAVHRLVDAVEQDGVVDAVDGDDRRPGRVTQDPPRSGRLVVVVRRRRRVQLVEVICSEAEDVKRLGLAD